MRLYIGCDHQGYELKEKLKKYLTELGYTIEDMGAFIYDQSDDYPDFISKVAQKVSEDPENNKGIILGSSGQGEAMAANKFKGVRTAVFYGPSLKLEGFKAWMLAKIYNDKFKQIIDLSREDNDSNILSLGASFLTESDAKLFVKEWLEAKFSGEARHVRRINKIKEIERG